MSKALVQLIQSKANGLLGNVGRFPRGSSAYFAIANKAMDLGELAVYNGDKAAGAELEFMIAQQVTQLERYFVPFLSELSAADRQSIADIFTNLGTSARLIDIINAVAAKQEP